MPYELTSMDYAEISLIAAGVLIVVGVAAWGVRRRRLGEYLRLPPGPEHDIRPEDLILATLAFVCMFMLAYQLWTVVLGSEPLTSRPATRPSDDELVEPQKTLAAITAQTINCVILLTIGWLRFRRSLTHWGLGFRTIVKDGLRAVVGYIALWPVCFGILYVAIHVHLWWTGEFPADHQAIEKLKGSETPVWMKAATILGAVVLAPIVEELLFRGLLLSALAKWLRSRWQAILISGALFGVIHLPLFHHVPALIVFGIILGFAYAKTKSLTLVILIHAVFNVKTVLWLFLAEAG